MNQHGDRLLLPLVAVGLLVLLLAPAALCQSTGRCYAAEVPGPIVLPDNTVEEAGRLEICLSRMYSPVAGFHRTSVNGRVAGLFISRRSSVDSPPDDQDPFFVFVRLENGRYELESYTCSDGRTQVTFDMREERVRSHWRVRQAQAGPVDDEPASSRTRVTLMASLAGAR